MVASFLMCFLRVVFDAICVVLVKELPCSFGVYEYVWKHASSDGVGWV